MSDEGGTAEASLLVGDSAQAERPIHCFRVGRVQVISYNRPARRNAWNAACARETVEAIVRANADPATGAILLTAEGTTFCAGTDLKDGGERDPMTNRRLTPASFTMGEGERNWLTLLGASKPVVAAINGPAVGVGATHILAADIRLAAESASFAFPFLKLGVMPECGSSALLPQLVGWGRARDILLRSKTIDAIEAERIGLVSAIYPDAELRDAALALAEELAGLPPLQVKLTKQMLVQNAANADPESVIRTESAAFVRLLRESKQKRLFADNR